MHTDYAVNNRFLTYSQSDPTIETNFCNEPIPFYRPHVQLHFNNQYQKYNTRDSYRILYPRAEIWCTLLKPIFKANGIPEDAFYIVFAESLLLNTISPAGATGFWQFMPTTASVLGLQIDSLMDERLNPLAATQAASAFLNSAYKRFGSWVLAIASYNLGQEGLEREIYKQKTKDFYKLQLNAETKSFIYKIIAFKALFSKSTFKSPASLNIKKLKLKKPTSLIEICKRYHLNYEDVKIQNAWIKGSFLPARQNEYILIYSKDSKVRPNTLHSRKRKK